jgi:ppGpp synthetase/RelA/SpoT-type nucleotidyltranferase
MNEQEQNILKEFNNLRDNLDSWGAYVDKELLKILQEDFINNNLLKIYPNYRLKQSKSYLYKALYRKKEYTNPLIDIEDKVGTRIVLLKSDDIEKAADIILNHTEWDAKITKNLTDEIENKPKLFDYQSMHLVVKPKEDKGYNNEIKDLLTCEIQIRTLLQHAFAEISHDSTYKGPYKNDKEILRHLAKSMALMEATDDYFCQIFTMMSNEE